MNHNRNKRITKANMNCRLKGKRLIAFVLAVSMLASCIWQMDGYAIKAYAGTDSLQQEEVCADKPGITTQELYDGQSALKYWNDYTFPKADKSNIKVGSNTIYVYGNAVVIQKNGEKTAVYEDCNRNGIVDSGESIVIQDGDVIAGAGGEYTVDLSQYTIYGGKECTLSEDVLITMNSGTIGGIYGGYVMKTEGSITINHNGGKVGYIIGNQVGSCRKISISSNGIVNFITGMDTTCCEGDLTISLGTDADISGCVIGNMGGSNNLVTGDVSVSCDGGSVGNGIYAVESFSSSLIQIGGNLNVNVGMGSSIGNLYCAYALSNYQGIVIAGSITVDIASECSCLRVAYNCKEIGGNLKASFTGKSSSEKSTDVYVCMDSTVYGNLSAVVSGNCGDLYIVTDNSIIYGDMHYRAEECCVDSFRGTQDSTVHGDVEVNATKLTAARDAYFEYNSNFYGEVVQLLNDCSIQGYLYLISSDNGNLKNIRQEVVNCDVTGCVKGVFSISACGDLVQKIKDCNFAAGSYILYNAGKCGYIEQNITNCEIMGYLYAVESIDSCTGIYQLMDNIQGEPNMLPVAGVTCTGDVTYTCSNSTFGSVYSSPTNNVMGAETVTYNDISSQSYYYTGECGTVQGNYSFCVNGWQNLKELVTMGTNAEVKGDSEVVIENCNISDSIKHTGKMGGISRIKISNCIAGTLKLNETAAGNGYCTIEDGKYGNIDIDNNIMGEQNTVIEGGIFTGNVLLSSPEGENYGESLMHIKKGTFNGEGVYVGGSSNPGRQLIIRIDDTSDVYMGSGVTAMLSRYGTLKGGMLDNKGNVTFEGTYVLNKETVVKTVEIPTNAKLIVQSKLAVETSFLNNGRVYMDGGAFSLPENSDKGSVYYPINIRYDAKLCNVEGDCIDSVDIEDVSKTFARVMDNSELQVSTVTGYTIGEVLFKKESEGEYSRLKADKGKIVFIMAEEPAEMQVILHTPREEEASEIEIDKESKEINLCGQSVILAEKNGETVIYNDKNRDGVADSDIELLKGDYSDYKLYGAKDYNLKNPIMITMLGGNFKEIYGCDNTILNCTKKQAVAINVTGGSVEAVYAAKRSEISGYIFLYNRSQEVKEISLGMETLKDTYVDNQGVISIMGNYPIPDSVIGDTVIIGGDVYKTLPKTAIIEAKTSITVECPLTVDGELKTAVLDVTSGTVYNRGRITAEDLKDNWYSGEVGTVFMQGGALSNASWKVFYPVSIDAGNSELDYKTGRYYYAVKLEQEGRTTYYGRYGSNQTCNISMLKGYQFEAAESEDTAITRNGSYIYWSMPNRPVNISINTSSSPIKAEVLYDPPVLECKRTYSSAEPAIKLAEWINLVGDAEGDNEVYEVAQDYSLPEGLVLDKKGNIYGTPANSYPQGKKVKLLVTGNNSVQVEVMFTIKVCERQEQITPISERIEISGRNVLLHGNSVVIRGDGAYNYIYADDDRNGRADTLDCVKVSYYQSASYKYSLYAWYKESGNRDVRVTIESGKWDYVYGIYYGTVNANIEIYSNSTGINKFTGNSLGTVNGYIYAELYDEVSISGEYEFKKDMEYSDMQKFKVASGASVVIPRDISINVRNTDSDAIYNCGNISAEGRFNVEGTLKNAGTCTVNGTFKAGTIDNDKEFTIEEGASVTADILDNSKYFYNWGALELRSQINNSYSIFTNEIILCKGEPIRVSGIFYPVSVIEGNEGGICSNGTNIVNMGTSKQPAYYGKSGVSVTLSCETEDKVSVDRDITRAETENKKALSLSYSDCNISFTMPWEPVKVAVYYTSDSIRLSSYFSDILSLKVGEDYNSETPVYDLRSIKITNDAQDGEVSYSISEIKDNQLPDGLTLSSNGIITGTLKYLEKYSSTYITVTGKNGTTARFCLNYIVAKGTPVITLEDQETAYSGEKPNISYLLSGITDSYSKNSLIIHYYNAETGEELEETPVEPGSYYVQITSSEDSNYEAAVSRKALLCIRKAFIDSDAEISNITKTYDGMELVPSVCCKQEGVSVTYSEDGKQYSEQPPTYWDAGKYTMYYRFQKEGYMDFIRKVYVIIDKAEPKISIKQKEYEWNGQAVKLDYDVIGISSALEEELVQVQYYWKEDILPEAPREEGEYKVNVVYKGSANYKKSSKESSIIIVRDLSAYNQKRADEAETLIAAIGNVAPTVESGKRISDARSCYDGLSESQRMLVSFAAVMQLEMSEELYNELWEEKRKEEQEKQDEEVAQQVINRVYQIGEPDGSMGIDIQIQMVEEAYEELTEEQKACVPVGDYNYFIQLKQRQEEIKNMPKPGATTTEAEADKPGATTTEAEADKPGATTTEAEADKPGATTTEAEADKPGTTTTEAEADKPGATTTEAEVDKPGTTATESQESKTEVTTTETVWDKAEGNTGIPSEESISKSPDSSAGTIITKKGVQYKILTIKGNKGTVMVSGVKKKQLKTLTIPDSITYKGNKYKVTTIGKKVFSQCKRLKKLVIKSKKIKRIKKHAFKNLPVKCKIFVPKNKMKTYKRLIKKSGYNKKVYAK